MANPVIVQITANTWNLVASNVTAGQIHRIDKRPTGHLQTYRMTGNPAPTSVLEGVPCFVGTDSEPIQAAAAIDVYIWPHSSDGVIRRDV